MHLSNVESLRLKLKLGVNRVTDKGLDLKLMD